MVFTVTISQSSRPYLRCGATGDLHDRCAADKSCRYGQNIIMSYIFHLHIVESNVTILQHETEILKYLKLYKIVAQNVLVALHHWGLSALSTSAENVAAAGVRNVT